MLIAIRDIEVGEEISYDYSLTSVDDDWELICQCASANCRKIIGEFRFLPAQVRQRYINLGIVPDYVLAEIERTHP